MTAPDPQIVASIAIEIELAMEGRTVAERAYHIQRAMELVDRERADALREMRTERECAP